MPTPSDPTTFFTLLAAAVLAVWFAGAWLRPRVAGWPMLAARYAGRLDRADGRWPFGHARIGRVAGPRVRLNNLLAVAVGPAGVELAPPRVAMFGAPPVVIPWAELRSPQVGQWLAWPTFSFVAGDTGVRVRLQGRAARLVQSAFGRWQTATVRRAAP